MVLSKRSQMVFAAVCFGLPILLTWRGTGTDVPLYFRYARALFGGARLYAEVPMEYPPLAALVFCLPYIFTSTLGAYQIAFMMLMAACDFLQKAVLWRAVPPAHRLFVVSVATACAAMLYYTYFKRFDLAATACTTVFISGALRRPRALWPWVMAGLGAGLKLYTLTLLPIVALYQWRCANRCAARTGLQGMVAVATFAFLVGAGLGIGGDAGWNWARYHRDRGIHVGSTYAAAFVVAHGIDRPIEAQHRFGSLQLLDTSLATWATRATWITLAALLVTYAACIAGLRSEHGVWAGCLAAVCALLLCSKVFSPQYAIWLVPLIAMVGMRDQDKFNYDWCTVVLGAGICWLSALLYPREVAFVLGNSYKRWVALARIVLLGTLWLRLCIRVATTRAQKNRVASTAPKVSKLHLPKAA